MGDVLSLKEFHKIISNMLDFITEKACTFRAGFLYHLDAYKEFPKVRNPFSKALDSSGFWI